MNSGSPPHEPIRHLYAHVPFCPVKCEYCAFVTHIGSLKLIGPYVEALIAEARLRQEQNPAGPLQTVYFGGGTPSMLPPDSIARLLTKFRAIFDLAAGAEITLECHPSTVTEKTLAGFRAAGVTRLSFGAESMNVEELSALGRVHTPSMVFDVIAEARRAGFETIGLDLMYGIPRQTHSSWRQTLDAALAAGVDHLSLYPLSVEPRTVFARRSAAGNLALPADDSVAEMYGLACSLLSHAGFEHYEISNWARPRTRCRHNTAYWENRSFHGIGVGAHAFVGRERTENVRQTKRYIERLAAGQDPIAWREPLTDRLCAAESLILGLRLLQEGPDFDRVLTEFGVDARSELAPALHNLSRDGLLNTRDSRVLLPETVVPVANEVWQRFLLD